jgi:hypothetical protein
MNEIRSYAGDAVHSSPPSGKRWAPIDAASVTPDLEDAAISLMGELDAYQCTDRVLPSGLYRLFAYETPIGLRISAQRFLGTMGDGEDDGSGDGGDSGDGGSDGSDGGDGGDGGSSDGSGPNNTPPIEAGNDPTVDTTQNLPGDSTSGGGGSGGGGGGQTTSEPTPPTSAKCGAWAASTNNAQVVGVAQSISYSNTPVAWQDQSIYYMTASDGTQWALTQWWENGLKMVAAHVCTQSLTGGPSGTASSSSNIGLILAIGGAVAAAAVIGVAAVSAHQRHVHKRAA